MRRVRSQLNNLAPSAPGGYAANHGIQPSVGFNRQTDEVQRRIDSMGLQPYGEPDMPMMYGHANYPGGIQQPSYAQPLTYPQFGQPQAPASAPQSSPELDNIKSSLERLTGKLQTLVQNSEASKAQGQKNQAEIGAASSQSIDALRLAMEADHNAILEQLRMNDNGIDPVAYARTVETSHDNVIRQISELEKLLRANSGNSEGLVQAVNTNHRDIVELITEVKNTIGNFNAESAGDVSNETAAMQMRVEELTRAVMALSSQNPGVDNLERIEARIGDLHKLLDTADDETASQDNADTVSSQLREVISLLGQMDANVTSLGPRNESGLDGLAAQINRLSEKVDNIGAIGGSTGDENPDNSALLERLDALVDRVENAKVEPTDPAILLSIESQIEKLSKQMEASGGQEGGIPAPADLQPVLEKLGQIEESIGNMSVNPETGGIHASLEQHLTTIAGRLNSLETDSPVSLEPIEQRLTGIEDQLGASRDITIELATQAAQDAVQQAVEAIPKAAATGEQVDMSAINMLADDLKLLNERTANIGSGSGDQFEVVRNTLESIANRLTHIESVMQSGPVHSDPVRETSMVGDLQPAQMAAEGGQLPQQPDAGRVDDGLPNVEPPSLDAPSLEMAETPLMNDEAYSRDNDSPLEPGTGTPDLAALVRQANKRRLNDGEDEHVSSGTDFIAAARRAAQAAAAEANMVEESETENAANSGRSGIAGMLKRRKKVIVMAAAVALMVALAAPYAGQLFGNLKNRIAGNEVASPAPIEQSMLDQDAADTDVVREVVPENTEELPGQETGAVTDSQEDGPPASDADVVSSTPAPAEPGNTTDGLVVNADQINFGTDLFKQAVGNGDPIALFEVARHYTDGIGVEKDLNEAARWYEKSASMGFAPAQYLIGNFNEKGIGVEQDNQNAASWYTEAAESGNVVAMHNLAVLYASPGKLSEQPDMEMAFKWFAQAAEHGVRDSQVNAGIFYTNGAGPSGVNLVEAYKWFAIAAKAGDSDAASKRDIVANAMRPDQLEQARAEAELWRPTEPDPAANNVTVPDEWKSGQAAGAMVSDHESVRKVQSMLARLGFDPGPADGVMGQKTREAITAFQKRAGLSVSGNIDPELMEALKAVSI